MAVTINGTDGIETPDRQCNETVIYRSMAQAVLATRQDLVAQ